MIFNPIYGGDASPNLGTKTITANGTYTAASDNLDGYDEVVANVPNTYTASDEGKVVSNGALTAQASRSVTANGTYDTTLNDEVVVDVPSSTPTLISKNITANGTYDASDDNADGYSQVVVNVSGGGSMQYDMGSFFGDPIATVLSSLSIPIEANRVGQKVWLVILHRAAVTVDRGMTLINDIKAENYDQWIAVYEKTITSASQETVTITQASSARMCACTIYVPATYSLGTPTQVSFDTSATTYKYSIPASNTARLVVMNNTYSATGVGATITPQQNTLPTDPTTVNSSSALRMIAMIVCNLNTVTIAQNIDASGGPRETNRLYLYNINI